MSLEKYEIWLLVDFFLVGDTVNYLSKMDLEYIIMYISPKLQSLGFLRYSTIQ